MGTEVNGNIYSIIDYLLDKVRFDVPESAIKPILIERGLDGGMLATDCDRDLLRLCYADLFKWYVIGASKVNSTSDSDNGWSHSGGGFSLDADDRKLIIKEANAIYGELEPSSSIKTKGSFRMMSFGVRHADYDISGNPLPHVIK